MPRYPKDLKSLFKAITEQSTDGITVADTEGNYTFVNPAFCKMMGYTEDELLNMTVFDVKAPNQDQSSFQRTKTTHEGEPFEVLLQRKDGSVFVSEVVGKNITVDGVPQVLGTIRDITEQVRTQEQIKTLSQAVEQSPVSIIVVGLDGHIQYINSEVKKKTSYKTNELINAPFSKLFSNKEDFSSYDAVWRTLCEGDPWEGELLSIRKDQSVFWEYAHFSPVKDLYGKTVQFLAVKEDITTRKQHEEEIIKKAHYDSLTQLPNRLLSLDRLSHAITEAKRDNSMLALLFIDLDDFKIVNDTLGHEAGDHVLIEAAKRLANTVREEDTVGRLGGDEFIAVLGGVKSHSDVSAVCQKLVESCLEPFDWHEKDLFLSVSIGIAIYPNDGHNASELLRNSDSAMYEAKEQGRNNYAFYTLK